MYYFETIFKEKVQEVSKISRKYKKGLKMSQKTVHMFYGWPHTKYVLVYWVKSCVHAFKKEKTVRGDKKDVRNNLHSFVSCKYKTDQK